VCSVTEPALAADAEPRLRAQELFDEARELFQAGEFPAACAKFAESQRLDPKGGTLLNLAICSEKVGKTATAFNQFSQAVAQARRDGRMERVSFAEEHLEALRKRLSSLTIIVPAVVRVSGLRVHVDGVLLDELAWDAKVPIDPGEHVISASAPGFRPGSYRVHVGGKAEQHMFTLPELTSLEEPAANTPSNTVENEPEPQDTGATRRSWGVIIGGLGIAAGATGIAFGVSALSGRQRAEELCRNNRCDAEGEATNDTARTHAWIANASLAAGIVGLGVGVYLYIVPSSSQQGPRRGRAGASVALHPRPGGLSLEGSF
jgi:hypothetical protein